MSHHIISILNYIIRVKIASAFNKEDFSARVDSIQINLLVGGILSYILSSNIRQGDLGMERREFHHVNKQEIPVTIETSEFRVVGIIDVLINHTITDELNNNSAFVEVRNAQVVDKASGQVIKALPEISLNKQCVRAVYRTGQSA